MTPQINDVYIDKICSNRVAEEYVLFQIDLPGNKYHLRKISTNEVVLVSLETLNVFYQLRVHYQGHM